MPRKPANMSTRAMLVLASIAATLIIVELVLEAISHERSELPPPRSIRLREHTPGRAIYETPSDRYVSEAESLVRREYPFRVDENGFIRPSELHANPDVKIVFLGGSTTECKFVLEENRFPYRVGRLLEKRFGIKCNSYNGGVSGNTSMHSNLVLFGKVVPMQPDFAVLMHNVNDLITLLYLGTFWHDYSGRSVLVRATPAENKGRGKMSPIIGMKAMSRELLPQIYARLHRIKRTLAPAPAVDEWQQLRHRTLKFQQEQMLAAFDRSLTTFCSVCRVYDIHPILMTQANRLSNDTIRARWEDGLKGTGVSYTQIKGVYDQFNQTVRSVANSQGAVLVDLADAIPPSPDYIYDSVHFNEQGSRLAADIIARDVGAMLANLPLMRD